MPKSSEKNINSTNKLKNTWLISQYHIDGYSIVEKLKQQFENKFTIGQHRENEQGVHFFLGKTIYFN